MAACLAAFEGVFTGTFAALIYAGQNTYNSALRAERLCNEILDDPGEIPDQMGIVTPVSIKADPTDPNFGVEVVYSSRSGNEYTFRFHSWYDNTITFPEDSSLREAFEKIAA